MKFRRTSLLLRLIKVWHKHRIQFGEDADADVGKLLKEQFGMLEVINPRTKKGYEELRDDTIHTELSALALKYVDWPIRHGFRVYMKKYFFCYPNRGDFAVLKFLCGVTRATNPRLFPICECGTDNSVGHATNECQLRMKAETREDYLKKFRALYSEGQVDHHFLGSLKDFIWHSYYCFKSHHTKANRKVSSLCKEVIHNLCSKLKGCNPPSSAEAKKANADAEADEGEEEQDGPEQQKEQVMDRQHREASEMNLSVYSTCSERDEVEVSSSFYSACSESERDEEEVVSDSNEQKEEEGSQR